MSHFLQLEILLLSLSKEWRSNPFIFTVIYGWLEHWRKERSKGDREWWYQESNDNDWQERGIKMQSILFLWCPHLKFPSLSLFLRHHDRHSICHHSNAIVMEWNETTEDGLFSPGWCTQLGPNERERLSPKRNERLWEMVGRVEEEGLKNDHSFICHQTKKWGRYLSKCENSEKILLIQVNCLESRSVVCSGSLN